VGTRPALGLKPLGEERFEERSEEGHGRTRAVCSTRLPASRSSSGVAVRYQ
jgi:hypothetical protein